MGGGRSAGDAPVRGLGGPRSRRRLQRGVAFCLGFVHLDAQRSSRRWAGAGGAERVHGRDHVDVIARLAPSVHDRQPALRHLNVHGLEDVEWVGDVLRADRPRLQRFLQDLVAAEWRTAERTTDRKRLGHAMVLAAHVLEYPGTAHAPLQIVIAISVLDDRQHDVVVAAVEMIAGRDRELALVRLGARLAETFRQIVGVEAHEVADLAAFDVDDANMLPTIDEPNSAFSRAHITFHNRLPARRGRAAGADAAEPPLSFAARLTAKSRTMRPTRSLTRPDRLNCASIPCRRKSRVNATRVAWPPCSATSR